MGAIEASSSSSQQAYRLFYVDCQLVGLIYKDIHASKFSVEGLKSLRKGGYEEIAFILGEPMLAATTNQNPDVTDGEEPEEPQPLMLTEGVRATGATFLTPVEIVEDAARRGTFIIVCDADGKGKEYEGVELRLIKRTTPLSASHSEYAESETYQARPGLCVIPHVIQGMQFPYGVRIWMDDWWFCEHMLYVASSRATGSHLVELVGAEGVPQWKWKRWAAVNPRAVLLRAWGGEEPPASVLEEALQKMRVEVAAEERRRNRLGDATAVTLPYSLERFIVGGGMKGAASADRGGRLGRCGKWLAYKQCVALDALEAGADCLVLLGAAGTGKTTLLSEWALMLEEKRQQKVWKLMSLASPTHAAGGRLRTEMAVSGLRVDVVTVAAQYGLGTKGSLKEGHAKRLKLPVGVIDEAMLVAPHVMDRCAEVQRALLSAP